MSDLIVIAPMRMELLPSQHECMDIVCRERRYFFFSEAPTLEGSREYVQNILTRRHPYMVALTISPLKVIGWCDINVGTTQAGQHVGTLGIGVHPNHRGQGIGEALITETLRHCRPARIEQVQLEVLANNHQAITLYQKLGFAEEGLKKKAWKLVNQYQDVVMMAKPMR